MREAVGWNMQVMISGHISNFYSSCLVPESNLNAMFGCKGFEYGFGFQWNLLFGNYMDLYYEDFKQIHNEFNSSFNEDLKWHVAICYLKSLYLNFNILNLRFQIKYLHSNTL